MKGFDWRAAAAMYEHEIQGVPGRLPVAVYWLPLECAPIASNASPGVIAGARSRALGMMRMQHLVQSPGRFFRLPLEGRPLVRVTRFSSVAGDVDNGASKIPVDRLLPNRLHRGKPVQGLGVILDDSIKAIEKVVEWKPGKRGHGAVCVEVWA